METVEQDFKFAPLSAAYGRFLIEIHSMDQAVKLTDVTLRYDYGIRDLGDVVIRAAATDDIAMLLKLRYGAHLVKIPARRSAGPYTMTILKSRANIHPGWFWNEGLCNEIKLGDYTQECVLGDDFDKSEDL